MSISFEYYKVFYYVAKYKKISLAAEKLFISQPAVTQTIHKLEEQLGGSLFNRNRNGIELTESGKTLFEFVSESIETLENAEGKFGKYLNLEEGSIKIRTGSNVARILLYDALEKFSKKYPNIKIEIATGAPADSLRLLHTGEVDIVLLYMPYNVEYANINIRECGKHDFVFAMSKNYFEDNNVKIKKIEDLNNYSLILPKKNSTIGKFFEKEFGDKITNCHYEVAAEQMKKAFLMKDMGIAYIIEDTIAEELKTGEIIKVDLKDTKISGGVGIATLKDDMANIATKKLVKFIIEESSKKIGEK